jgi:hypothetical protein
VEPQRLEIESEAWYRAIAEGRLSPVSDPKRQRVPAMRPVDVRSWTWRVEESGAKGPIHSR